MSRGLSAVFAVLHCHHLKQLALDSPRAAIGGHLARRTKSLEVNLFCFACLRGHKDGPFVASETFIPCIS